MKKKKFFSYLFLGLLAVGATGTVTSCKDYDDDINAANTRIDGLQSTIDQLKQQHQTDIQTLQTAQAEFATKIALRDTASALRAAATAAAAQAQSAAETRALNLAQQLQDAINQKADKSSVDALEQSLKDLIATKANQSDYQALLDKVTALDGNTYSKSETDALIAQAKAALEGEIASINTALDTKLDKTTFDQKVNELTTAYKNADKALDDKYAGIVAKLASQADLQQQIDALEAFKAQVDAQNITNNGKFVDLGNKITDLTGRVSDLESKALTADDLAELNSFMQATNNYINSTLPTLLAAKANANDVYTKDEIKQLLSTVPVADNVYTKAQTYSQTEIEQKLGDATANAVAKAKEGYDAAIASYRSEVTAALGSKVDTTQFKVLEATVSGITTNLNNLNVLLQKTLTSLVYKADKYALSFPEIEVASFNDLPTYTVDLTKAEPVSTNEKEKVDYAPNVIAKYWLNPSSADIDGYTYKFVDLETTNETRSHEDTTKCVDNSSLTTSAENGVLTVNFKVDAANVNNAITKEKNGQKLAWVSTVALQATKKNSGNTDVDRTITSDYALLTPSWYKNLRLGNNKYAPKEENAEHEYGNQQYHLNRTVAATKTEDGNYKFSFVIPYTGDSIVDLNKYIDLHYAYSANSTDFTEDHVWSHKEATDHGFTFKYTLLPTETKDNKAVVPEEFKLEDGKVSIAEGKNTRAAVNKNAIVLVEMQANGKTVAYGYVSVLISNNAVQMVEKLGDLTLNCPTDANGTFNAEASYTEFTDSLATLLGYTPAEFNDRYYLAGDADNRAKYLASDGNARDNQTVGKIVVENGKLIWKFTEADVKKAFYNEDGTPNDVQTYSTWVEFTSKNTTLNPTFRIQVTIPAIHRPAGSFAYDNRIQQYWFGAGSTKIAESAEARAEIHANVEVVGQTDANDEFIYNIENTFVGNKFTITPENVTPAFTFDKNAVVTFDASKYPVVAGKLTTKALGASGTTYYLSVDDAATKLYASEKEDGSNAQEVVVLSGDDNEIATFQHNDYAEDLLNVAEHTKLNVVPANANPANEDDKATFTSHMVLKDRNNCLPVDLTGGKTFDIRYLRPIDAVKGDAATAYDAQDNGNKLYLADLVSFKDWRDVSFTGSNKTYVDYYGIKAITPDLDNVYTNINGRRQKLSEVTSALKLKGQDATGTPTIGTYDKNNTAKSFKDQIGYINYENVGSVVGGFYLDIPVTVTYDWGTTASVTIRINVVDTKGNPTQAKRR